MKRSRPIQIFHANSILAQMLLLFLALLLLVCFFLTSFAQRFYSETYLDKSLRSAALAGEAAATGLDHLLELEQMRMDSFFMETVNSQLLAGGASADVQESAAVGNRLQALVDQSVLARRAGLYLYSDDSLLTSEREFVSPATWPRFQDADRGDRPCLLLDEDNGIWLIYGYPAFRPVFTLLLELDAATLYRQLFRANTQLSDGETWAFLADGTPLFTACRDYPPYDDYLLRPVETEADSPYYCLADDTSVYVTYCRAPLSDCVVLTMQEKSQMTPSYFAFLRSLLPYLLLMLAAVGGVFFLLERKVYTPLRDMVTPLLEEGPPVPSQPLTARNEFDYLKQAYRDQDEKNDLLRHLLHTTAQPVLTRLLQLLLQEDDDLDPQELAAMLDTIDHPFLTPGGYWVAALYWDYSETASGGVLRELRQADVDQHIELFWQERCVMLQLTMGRCSRALLLHYPAGCDREGPERDYAAFREQLTTLIPKEYCHTYAGRSGPVNQLTQLPAAYREAQAAMYQYAYYDSPAPPLAAIAPDGEDPAYLRWCQQQLAMLFEQVLQENEEAAPRLERLLAQIRREPLAAPEQFCRLLGDSVTEFLLRQQIDVSQLPEPQRSGDCFEGLAAQIQQALSLLSEAMRGKQYGYVNEARKYIAAHSYDSTLSVESVAQRLGLSRVYLSTLFNRYTPAGFAAYLRGCRLEQACGLLRKTALPIGEVGYKTGFASPQAFNMAFKKQFHETPSQYRKRLQSQEEEEA